MVLINDKKYACATCIKGHRVSGCTHTDRPLFEVKKKGRPATQCQFCREKRKGGSSAGSVHTKCTCGDLKNQQPSTIPAGMAASMQSAAVTPSPRGTETKKGQPGSTPTFPNGLRDVHEMAAAAEALAGLGGENSAAAERDLRNLLNPCNCRTTGRCRCCAPKRPRSPPPAHSPARRPSDAHAQPPSHDGHSGSTTPTTLRSLPHLSMTSAMLASPDNRHHPAHTSPYVHKTKLYSPYSNGQSSPRHAKSRSASVSSASTPWPSTSVSPRPPPTRLRPLTDMSKFLGAVFHDDGSVVSQVPRSALGLPGIHTFVSAAESGGVKVEPMEMDVDVPVSFPTSEEVVIGACTCGEGCQCSGCATHGNPRSTSPKQQHGHDGACGDACKSCFDCGDQVSIPSGVASIEQLIQIAAANVPKPLRANRGSTLDALDTRVLPPAANMSEDVARAFGVVQLKPLECCNGRCQCSPGECKCENDCCGCCTECKCGDHDGDAVMADGDADPGEKQPAKGGCCGGGPPATPSRNSLQVASSSGTCSVSTTPINLSPTATIPGVRLPSPSVGTPPNGGGPMVRRNSSVSRAKEKEGASSGAAGRRLSTSSVSSQASVQRSASSSGKPTSKSLAINTHSSMNAHHHRPILPKPVPASAGGPPRLAPPRPTGGSLSRQPSPVHRSRASSQASSQSSPAIGPNLLPQPPEFAMPPSVDQSTIAPNQQRDSVTTRMGDMAIGVDDIATALAASDVDFMTYLNSLLSSADGDQSASNPTFDVSQAGGLPDTSLLNAFSGATPRPELESSLGDIQELIAGALARQGVLQSPPQAPAAPPTSQPPEFNYFFSFPATSMTPRDEQLSNYQISPGAALPMQQPMPQFAPTGIDPLQQFDDNFFFNQYPNGLSLQVPSLQTDSGRTSNSGEVGPSIPAVSPAPSAPANHPDIIDLSKPLNSSDIDRIMQALLNQQARQAGASGAMPQPPPQVSPQLPRPNGGGSVPDASDPFQQYMIDPDTPPNTHLQQPGAALSQHAWMPNVLGQSVQRE
ncbi:uncharacterized protein COLE_00328 [Cutaneotrichosporon oleaginosum]|nr:hypothetical protein COLE_00328 [Cutaneotrichosporon oleaginosum]